MTDAPPPSIPPSIPPRKRPAAEPDPRAVRTVPGRGDVRTDGTAGQRPDDAGQSPTTHVNGARQAPLPSRTEASGPPRGPLPEAPRPAPAPLAGSGPSARTPFPVVGPPTPFPVVGAPDDDQGDRPSPLAAAVEQTGQWLRKAAGAAGTTMSSAYSSLTRPRPKDDPMTATPEAPSAFPRTAPPTAPATTGGAPTVRPASGRTPVVGPGPRRVRLAISRLDPWSVMKLSFLLSFAAGIMLVVAVSVLWLTLDGLHVFTSMNNLVKQIVGNESSVNILDYVQFSRVLSVSTLVAVVDVVLLTALATIGAFLYNVVAALVGGVHVTMTDE